MPKNRTARLPTTQQGWIRRWRNSLKVMAEKAAQLRDDREVYNKYRSIVVNNAHLDKSNAFLVLVEDMYVSHMLVGLRTFDDRDNRSHSLYNLIGELTNHRHGITKEWFIDRYPKRLATFASRDATRCFRSARHLTKQALRKDLSSLTRSCRTIRRIVNKYIAHMSRKKPRLQLTYEAVNESVETICELVDRYCLLLHAGPLNGCPGDRWTGIFEMPWKHKTNKQGQ